jgi:tetratricopeptide (TPR) repeat protein
LLGVLLIRASQQPLLFVLEDVHWVDPSTLDLLNLFIDHAPATQLCILLTFRPDFTPPWELRSYLAYITLSRLPRKEIENMVGRVTKGKALPEEVLNHLASKTDGVPLFVEEMTKTLLESGMLKEKDSQYELTGSLMQLTIPTTLRDSLMARLDHLATAKEVAQLAAVLGREFPYEWLHAVSPLNEATLNEELARLVNAELLYRRGVSPNVSYIFKHALIQDAAYESLLKSTRQQYHRQFAEILSKPTAAGNFSEIAEAQPELLAHHYTEAGLKKEAIDYWQKAGQRAVQRSANIEAIGHLTKGLELLRTLPDTPERIQQELILQITLGPALMAAKGFAAPEVGQAYGRAQELCGQIDEIPHPQLFPALFGVWSFRYGRGELQPARELGEQLLRLAQSGQDPALLLEAHHALWPALVYLGELTSGQAHWEQGITLYDPQHHRSLALLYGGHDPGVCCRSFAEVALWLMGYPDQALKKGYEALTLAQELAHPFSLTFALEFAAKLHQLRREEQATQERAEAVIALSKEQGFVLTLAWGTSCWGGWW